MGNFEKDALIKNHQKILISEINVLRRLNLTLEECSDEESLRRFCSGGKQTLPDMIEIVVQEMPESDELYAFVVKIYEQPNLAEQSSA